MSSTIQRSSARDRRVRNSIALISSGGHTFVIERRLLGPDDSPAIETYVLKTPVEEGDLTVLRLGAGNDGLFGVELYFSGSWPMATERALWWVHALHATTRFAEELNRRSQKV